VKLLALVISLAYQLQAYDGQNTTYFQLGAYTCIRYA